MEYAKSSIRCVVFLGSARANEEVFGFMLGSIVLSLVFFHQKHLIASRIVRPFLFEIKRVVKNP